LQGWGETQESFLSARRVTRITIETENKWVFQVQASSLQSWCPECLAEVQTLTQEQAWAVAGKLLPDMEGMHAVDASDGSRQICLPSLLKLIGRLPGRQTK
jgi:hypothetical protein